MIPEECVFWLAPFGDTPEPDPNVLCQRHADTMVMPGGWTLDDQRVDPPQLFASGSAAPSSAPRHRRRPARAARAGEQPIQLQIDGTGEIERAGVDGLAHARDIDPEPIESPGTDTWTPKFDATDNLDGLLEVSSPLLARAFRGTDRRLPKR